MKQNSYRAMKRTVTVVAVLLLMLCLFPAWGGREVCAAPKGTTVYKGVDYGRVYEYTYYIKKYPSVKKAVGSDPKKVLQYFVKKGMARQHQAIKTFNVRSYRYGNPSLRRRYRLDYRKYYRHYMKKGYKTAQGRSTRTGITTLQKPITVYGGRDYSATYSYTWYRAHNPDVRKKYGEDDYGTLLHYVKYGMREGRPGNAKEASGIKMATSAAARTVSPGSCSISSCKIVGSRVKVEADTNLPDGVRAGLYAVPSYRKKLTGLVPVATAAVSGARVTFSAPLNLNRSNSLLQCKFLIGLESGSAVKTASGGYYIQNPEAAATNKKAFPRPARGTKKGLKSLISSDTYRAKLRDLKCSHVIADFPIEQFLGGIGLKYTYEGKTYEFSSSIVAYQSYLKQLRDMGIAVTGVFYLSKPTSTRYMLPSAAKGDKSKSTIFALNTANSNRKELEALFSCLGEYFTTGGALMGNWVFGNESNQFRTYCYSGNVSYSSFIQSYCDSFRLFNTAVKSKYAKARTYLSFDHNWNLSFDLGYSYNARRVLGSIRKQLKEEGIVHFDVALHPYPSPEQDPRLWNRSSYVKDSDKTQQYTMLNVGVIARYIKKTCGSDTHIILPETGINSVYQGKQMEGEQAAAVALAYYLTEFNSDIDMIGIHREADDPAEATGGFALGLYSVNFGRARQAAKVFRDMDGSSWRTATKKALKTIGISAWSKLVPGFKGSRFKAS